MDGFELGVKLTVEVVGVKDSEGEVEIDGEFVGI